MKTKILSVALTGALALGAAGQSVRVDALCRDGKCELNKPFELNCNMNSIEVIKQWCQDAKNPSECISMASDFIKHSLNADLEELKEDISPIMIEREAVDILEHFAKNEDDDYCQVFSCEGKSLLDLAEEAGARIFETNRWVYHCLRKGE